MSNAPDNVRKLLIAAAVTLLGTLAWRAYSPDRDARPTEPIRAAIDLNTADRAELLQVPGVGPHMVDAILAEHQTRGRFESLEQLDRVSGIGPKTIDRLRPWLAVGPGQSLASNVERLERKTASVTKPPASGVINLNTASTEELQSLPGIGVKLADRIIAERARAKFTALEDLRRVSGIGPKTLDKIKPLVTFQ